MSDPLPPLDFREEIRDFKAKEEVKKIEFPHCSHKDITIKDGRLSCSCGAAWRGPMQVLLELKKELLK